MASPRRVHTRPQQPQPQPQLRSPADGSLLAFLRHDRAPSSRGVEDGEEEEEEMEEPEEEEDDADTHDARPRTRLSATGTAPQSAPPTPSGTTTTTTTTTTTKRSRYLRESDRRDVIRRIDGGEKQSALAKEFGVTRAAICHINKNRVEILTRSARADVHAGARHPKRGLYSTSRSNFYVHELDGRGELPIVYEVRSLALALHLTTLRSVETSARQFRATADRAFRVLLEEALAAVPTRHVEVVAANGATCPGLATLRPACAMFMSESGYPMFEAFRAIQPDCPTGFMTLDHDDHDANNNNSPRRRVALRKLCAPAELHNHNVLLLDATCASALEARVAIQSLLDFGAQESSIFFVTLVISAAAIAEVCEAFPRVHIVAAAVDPEVTPAGEIRPGLGNFQERYFNTSTIRQSDLGSNVDL